MKRFQPIFAVSLAVFVAACAVSYFFRSDGLGLPGVRDGIRRLGFPLVIWEQGGIAYHHTFSLGALMADLAVAVVAGVLISALYSRVTMRIVFYCIGALAVACGAGLVIATVFAKFASLTGYSAGGAVALAGAILFIAALKNYRGDWSFVTGIGLSTLALAGFGGQIDDYMFSGGKEDFIVGSVLSFIFLTFGVFSLSSSHKLHRCLVQLERNRGDANNEDYSI